MPTRRLTICLIVMRLPSKRRWSVRLAASALDAADPGRCAVVALAGSALSVARARSWSGCGDAPVASELVDDAWRRRCDSLGRGVKYSIAWPHSSSTSLTSRFVIQASLSFMSIGNPCLRGSFFRYAIVIAEWRRRWCNGPRCRDCTDDTTLCALALRSSP